MAGVYLVLSVIFVFIQCSIVDRSDLGHPTGFMSICPGTTKPAEIPRSQLKFLSFVVQGNHRTRQKYTYWSAKNIIKDPRMNLNRKTLVLAIGYLDSPNFIISTMLANEYEARNYNVIMIDNQRFATVDYQLATRMMRPVGKHVAEVLAQLTESGLDPAKTELLGFSLGGQTVGFIGRSYQQLTGRNFSMIVSLEPSGPCYRFLDSEHRLHASNADFVQVIHTNIDGFGMATPMGHVDFYINGGEYQPSDITLYGCTATCSHFRVLTLWISALKHTGKFLAIKCNNVQQARDADCYKNVPLVTNVMGLTIDKTKQGIFYLSTGLGYPYYLGEKGLSEDYVYWKGIVHSSDGNETNIYT